MKPSLAFVGAGKMVTAIVRGLLSKNIFSPEEMTCVSAPDGTSEKLAADTGICRAETLEELLATRPDRILLGCKPINSTVWTQPPSPIPKAPSSSPLWPAKPSPV